MPFTLAHAAAALPFRNWHLIPSAVVVGTLAPDFEYFILLEPVGRFGHTLPGAFVLTLPVALVILWLFHRFVKVPAIMLMPESVRRRLENPSRRFRFGGVGRFLAIAGSILLGIATHLLWDSFTHPFGCLYDNWSVFRQMVRVPIIGLVPCYEFLQHVSTIIGVGVLCGWLVRWYSKTEPSDEPLAGSFTSRRKIMIVCVVTGIACVGALIRAVVGTEGLAGQIALKQFAAQALITVIALWWWQLVAYGLFFSKRMLLLAILALGVVMAPLPAEEPRNVSVCDIAASADRFNGEMVTVRGRVRLAFEDFELPAEDCGVAAISGVWLEYGRGPKRQPTTWCCGDMVPRDSLELIENRDFHAFDRSPEAGARFG